MDMDLKPNFTPRAQEVISGARIVALSYNKRVITEDHLCTSMAKIATTCVDTILQAFDLERDEATKFCTSKLTKGKTPPKQKSYFSSSFKSTLGKAVLEAEKHEHDYIGVEHIMLAILKSQSSSLCGFFISRAVELDSVSLLIKTQFLVSTASNLEPSRLVSEEKYLRDTVQEQDVKEIRSNYFVCMNNQVKQQKFDEVIGRNKEIADIAEVLCRRSKNNPILLGEPGVGKTAVIEGLAAQIVKGNCTDYLFQKNIYNLDLAAMIAGTKYRGQFEERLKKTMSEIQKDPNAVLFIDEIHTIVGAGSAEGTMDAANILKPMLARGEIMCIGATTQDEYRKTICKDGALDRRFQPVLIGEPDKKYCKKILEGLKLKYENFHGVKYTSEVLDLCIKLSSRFILDRQLPDKAIDLMDQAGAKSKINAFKRPEEAQQIEIEIEELYEKESKSSEPHILIKKRESLMSKYQEIIQEWAEESISKTIFVENSDVHKVLTQKTGIPFEQISSTEKQRFLSLENNLNNSIIGQQEAIKKICESLIRNKAGLQDPSKPMGSFLFLGPSGVGKTYIAKQLALLGFGSSDNIIQLDMSEYSEQSSASKFTGASPGYIGFEGGGSLVEKVRKNPHGVILFDEIEKAHGDVTNLLLQILEEGKLTDSSGKEISFKNSVIILTGNIGSQEAKKEKVLGFGGSEVSKKDIDSDIVRKAKNILKPELINRLESILVFNTFNEKDLMKIVKLELEKSTERILEKVGGLNIKESVVKNITKRVISQNDGARPVKNLIKIEIENPIARILLKDSSESVKKKELTIYLSKNSIKVR
jgi:ATP-dependent Clp protease ATP-binding subunit ClpC